MSSDPLPATIVALSTPPGRGGIGVVRLSGSDSLSLARQILADPNYLPEPNHASLHELKDPRDGSVLDSALVTYFRSPRSFTGEDVIEFSCHGSPVLLRTLITALLELGARVAEPGEFTLRALTHGRLNLTQAEAIRDLIDAHTEAGARQATRQMRGELAAFLQPMKERLLSIIVVLESALEFVEDDLPAVASERIASDLTILQSEIEELAGTFRSGRLVRDGIKIALVGRPNVGKSSLFNRLVVADRAIVTDVPGTTRDTLGEFIDLDGVPVHLTDTAGLRTSADVVEQLGVERTRRAMADAELVVVVLDGSQPLEPEDEEILAEASATADSGGARYLVVCNKADLRGRADLGASRPNADCSLSALTGEGMDQLRKAIVELAGFHEAGATGLMITTARHYDLLQRAAGELAASCVLLDQRASEELVLVGLHDALRFLGEITGETTPDQILGQIFATFCIGK